MRQIIQHFTDDDLYKFTMCCAVIDNFPRACVRYEFVDRNNMQYPEGFAAELEQQIALLEGVKITSDEIDYMKRRCNYLPHWFYDYLKGYRYDRRRVRASQDAEGHLRVSIEGRWSDVIMFEVKLLAIISELYYEMTSQTGKFDLEVCFDSSMAKARRLEKAGCLFSDMGTRRRASFAVHDAVVRAMAESRGLRSEQESGDFIGTSNVYLAMKYDLMPIGTMAHEIVCAIAGMYGPQMANHLAMEAWAATYRGALGTFLYDTYGWEAFSLNFSEDYANMFKGLRVDSGDNLDQLDKICKKYRSLGIDARTKQVIFSNALSTDSAITLQGQAAGRCLPMFGIGTHFTNDIPDVKPLNIVIKLIAAKITESWPYYNDTCKLSEDKGKYTGKLSVVNRFLETLHREPIKG